MPALKFFVHLEAPKETYSAVERVVTSNSLKGETLSKLKTYKILLFSVLYTPLQALI
jgi:hypothetical protein